MICSETRLMKLAATIFAGVLALAIANAEEAAKAAPEKKAPQKKSAKQKSTPKLPKKVSKLLIKDEVVGTGDAAATGKQLTVKYTGWLYDPAAPNGRGKEFDSSIGKKDFTFTLGKDAIIAGWEKGVVKMKKGGKRQLTIPADMAYGSRGAGSLIPPNSPLVFEIELVEVM
jgi:FKBP-type peptidyl-prolyl cis-trans isomerase FkpA